MLFSNRRSGTLILLSACFYLLHSSSSRSNMATSQPGWSVKALVSGMTVHVWSEASVQLLRSHRVWGQLTVAASTARPLTPALPSPAVTLRSAQVQQQRRQLPHWQPPGSTSHQGCHQGPAAASQLEAELDQPQPEPEPDLEPQDGLHRTLPLALALEEAVLLHLEGAHGCKLCQESADCAARQDASHCNTLHRPAQPLGRPPCTPGCRC